MNELFSPTEQKILKILGRRKMTIKQLCEGYYKGKKKPLNPQQLVSNSVKRIEMKCYYHKLPWFINAYGLGRGGKTIWKDKTP